MKVQTLRIYAFYGAKMRNFGEISRQYSPPYIFFTFLETFTPIIELSRLESVRRHQVNTLSGCNPVRRTKISVCEWTLDEDGGQSMETLLTRLCSPYCDSSTNFSTGNLQKISPADFHG
jgi:hypothetical protein